MAVYHVSFPCIWSIVVEADNPEEAATMAECECPCNIDGEAYVVDTETGEEFDCI